MVVEVVKRALGVIAEPLVALELRWEPRGDEIETFWQLELHAIVAKPGDDHSVYSSVPLYSLPAHTLEQRQDTHAIARTIADASALPLHAPAVEDEVPRDYSTWIDRQPAGPMLRYTFTWEARYWTDAGIEEHVRGTDVIEETCGRAARYAIYGQLADRFAPRPLTLELADRVALTLGAPYPTGLPAIPQLRELARTHACRPSPIARDVVERAPNATALQLMLAFRAAFTPRGELAPYRVLGAWHTGNADAVVLDDVLTPLITNARRSWDRPSRPFVH